MKKRVVSLLLAAALLCAVTGCAWAAEKDKYQAFVDKYGPGYETLNWEQAIGELGGVDAIDWGALAYAAGYEGEQNIPFELLMDVVGLESFFTEIWPPVSEAEQKLSDEHFATASELVKKFCSKQIMKKYPLDTLDEFLDLLVNRLMPQSVQLVLSRVPAFRNAPAGSFSSQIGLMFETYSADGYAAAARAPFSETVAGLQMTMYLKKWMEQTEDGGYILKKDEKTAADLNHSIPHEFVHLFMYDYNRNATCFLRPDDYSYDEYDARADAETYPSWFLEGSACLIAGNYRLHAAPHQRLGLMNLDGEGPSCTPEQVRQVFKSYVKNLYETYTWDDFYATYIFGTLATAWLSDMQWQADGHPSAVAHGADGSVSAIDGEGLLNGISRILERMHNGETLDDIIRRITRARFLDTEDFGLRFVQGGNGGSDEGTAAFCADWLNYLEALSRQKGYIVSGSLLTGLGSDIMDMLDWNKTASADLYVPIDRNFQDSTASSEITQKTGTVSYFNIDTYREGAKYICSEGADGVYVKGSGTPLPFVFERTVNNGAAFSHFLVLETNGSILAPGRQYTAASGSVKAELLPVYLDTLAPDTYKLTAVFDDEKAVTVNFTVEAGPESTAPPADVPKTGDSAPLALWAGIAALGLAGIWVALVMGKRRKAGK